MLIKGLIDEDFVQYKKPSMFIIFPYCDFKCDREAGCSICQNGRLAHEPNIDISINDIVERYVNNPITKAIVMGGLEPFDTWDDLLALVVNLRYRTSDDIVIYTGYTEEELESMYFNAAIPLEELSLYENIIIKFGRYRYNEESHYDEVLGVKLASSNQYARRVSYND